MGSAAAGPSEDVDRMLVTYRSIHSMRVHATVPGASWNIEYEAPNRYKVDSNRFNAVVIGDDAWTLQRRGWKHMPPGTGRAILEKLDVYRAIFLTGGTYDYRITDRGVTPGVGHQYEFGVASCEPITDGSGSDPTTYPRKSTSRPEVGRILPTSICITTFTRRRAQPKYSEFGHS